MRVHANLPATLGCESAKAAAIILNLTLKRKLGWRTPYEMVYKVKPNVTHLYVFGCRVYLLRKNIPRLEKLAPRAYIGYLVGYNSTNIYRIWIPSRDEVVRTRDVTFDETKFYDPTELDLAHVLREEPSRIIELIDDPSPVCQQDDIEDEILDNINVYIAPEQVAPD